MSSQPHSSPSAQNQPLVIDDNARYWVWRQLWAVLRHRCPRCHRGQIFRGVIDLNDPCPVCGLIIEREEGYFLGAMYVSSVIGSAAAGLFYWAIRSWLPDLGTEWFLLVFCALWLPLVPFIVRWSRVIWIHWDRWVCPGDVSAGPYEKQRERLRHRQARQLPR